MDKLTEIYFNYATAIRQAHQLDEIAAKLKNTANQDMERILENVSRVWKSPESVPAYIRKGRKVEEDMQTTADNIRNIAEVIRTIAERMKATELAAWEIANERNS